MSHHTPGTTGFFWLDILEFTYVLKKLHVLPNLITMAEAARVSRDGNYDGKMPITPKIQG